MASVTSKQRPDRASGKQRTVYVTRWRDPAGRHRERTFARKADANDWAVKVENDKRSGAYADPKVGRIAFAAYAERWLETKRSARRATTVASYELNLCKHILPTLGDRPLAAIQRSEVQAWVNATGAALGPNTLRTVYGFVASIFREAVRDRLIAYTPCDRITLPAKVATEVSPLTAEQVMALANAINPRYRALVITGAGTGLRPSELFGLTVDRIDFLRRTIKVDRQLARATAASGAPLFGPPKTESSKRSVPLPQTVTDALAAHLAEYGNGPAGLVFTNTGRGATGFGSSAGRPIRRNAFDEVWRAGVRAAGLPGHTTPHDLRHTYASLLIAANESPKVIQARLGHKDISETFNTYGHLFPTADDSTRSAIDGAFNADAPSTPRQQRGTPTNRQ